MAKDWGEMEVLPLSEADGRVDPTFHVDAVFDFLEFNKQYRVKREIIMQLKAIHSRIKAVSSKDIYLEQLRNAPPQSLPDLD